MIRTFSPFFDQSLIGRIAVCRPKNQKNKVKAVQLRLSDRNKTIIRVPLTELSPFPNHTYGIRDDQAMQDTADSMKQSGVVVPAIVRPDAEGGYEIVAEQRRKLAS